MRKAEKQPIKVQGQDTQVSGYLVSRCYNWPLSIIDRADEAIETLDLPGMLQSLLDLMIEVSQAKSAYFFQLDASTDELVVTCVRGSSESQNLVGLRLDRQKGLPGIALGETGVMVIGDLTSDPDWLRMVDQNNSVSKKNVISIPIFQKETSLGAVHLFNYERVELDVLSILGSRLSSELVRRRKMEALQQSNQRLLSLVDMLGDIAGTLDRNKLMRLVTENATHLVGAERSSLFLVDPNTHQTIYQVAYQPSAGENGQPSRVQEETNQFTQSHSPVPASSPRPSRPLNRPVEEFSHISRSAITVPLSSSPNKIEHVGTKDYVLGGLMVLNNVRASFQDEDAQLLRILANQAGTFLQVAEVYEATEELFLGVIKSLISAIEAKDPYTQGHSQRVSDYSVLIAQELGLNGTLINDIRIGSLLHDIGKIGIPDSILLKQGRLTTEEMETMRKHPRTGVNILSQVKLLDPMRPAILEHHERLDGSGYPAGLNDRQISWMGRIVAVADVFDAMTSNRPYRQALSVEDVLTHLRENIGVLFDGMCVQALEVAVSRFDPNA